LGEYGDGGRRGGTAANSSSREKPDWQRKTKVKGLIKGAITLPKDRGPKKPGQMGGKRGEKVRIWKI